MEINIEIAYMKRIELSCAAINISHLSRAFKADIPRIVRDRELLIRSISDDDINIVINLDDTSGIAIKHPTEYTIIEYFRSEGYRYLFLSGDF